MLSFTTRPMASLKPRPVPCRCAEQQQRRQVQSSSRATNSMQRDQLLLLQFALLLTTTTMMISCCSANPVPMPFNRHEYPSIDLRLLDWPMAQRGAVEEGKPYTQLECYTELDRSFVDPSVLYRVNNTGQLSDRACMLRIPTGTRLTVVRMHVHSSKSYVTVLAGSSQVFMPLRTEHIHKDETDRYGPWHVPCQQAYLVFRSKAHSRLEWMEFRLGTETEEDRDSADSGLCTSEGVNHAELEYAEETATADHHHSHSSHDNQQQSSNSKR